VSLTTVYPKPPYFRHFVLPFIHGWQTIPEISRCHELPSSLCPVSLAKYCPMEVVGSDLSTAFKRISTFVGRSLNYRRSIILRRNSDCLISSFVRVLLFLYGDVDLVLVFIDLIWRERFDSWTQTDLRYRNAAYKANGPFHCAILGCDWTGSRTGVFF